MSQAGLELDIPEDQVDIVDDILVRDGRKPPPGLSVRKKVGTTDLTTEAADLSRAVNELDYKTGNLSDLLTTDKSALVLAINEIMLGGGHDADVYLPVGTLGSFYSCTSLADTSPTLIATGKNTIAEMVREKQKCTNWAFQTEFTTVNSKITTDSSDNSVYVSTSSSGGCFNVAGGLQTLPVLADTLYSNKAEIRALEVLCSDSGCSTVETYADYGYQAMTIPSLDVTCVDDVCTTAAIELTTIPNDFPIYVPSLTVAFMPPTAGSLGEMCRYELDH